jgi:hypothetical protein
MGKFCLAIEKIAKSLIATIIIAIVVFTSTSQLEVKAQAIEILGNSDKLINIGKYDVIGSNSQHALAFGNGYSGQWRMNIHHVDSNNYGFGIYRSGYSNPLIYIRKNDCIGIKYWSPSYDLDLSGGLIRAGNVVYSDKRSKRDIKPLDNLDNLFKVNSVQYKSSGEAYREQLELFKQNSKDIMSETDFNSAILDMEKQISAKEADTRTYFGFIAQELREVYPDLVYEDNQGYLSVNYVGLIPVLVDAIKELNSKIERIEGKNREVMPSNISSAVLYQNNPNPFSERTEIKFYVPENSSNAFICIYDMVGSQLMKLDVNAGYSSIFVNGSQLKAGMYLYSLIVDGKEIDTKRMILTDN